MLSKLPRDIVQHIGTLIEETPERWNELKIAFENSDQALQSKRNEVLQREVWIEIHENSTEMFLWKIHMNPPTKNITDNGFKILTLRTTLGEVVTALNQKTIKCGQY